MPDSFYRSGQAAKQLGVSSYYIRRLCEVGEITAEITAGQQWRIPASEIARLRREGVPDVPVESEDGEDDSTGTSHRETDSGEPPEGLLAAPSEELIEAAEEVKIVESRLKKRRVEKEAEEVEDWFRDRNRRQAEIAAAERQKAEAAQAEQRRRKWLDSWIQYALNSRPHDAPRETELEIHQVVQTALASLSPDQPQYTTQRLVDAAVEKVLRPWKRKKEIRSAAESALNRLPWDINYRPEWAPVKQRALEAAAAAIGKLPADATSSEMQQVAWLAVQPMAQEYAQWQACRELVRWITLPGGTYAEDQQARQAVSEALAQLPVGASQRELEKTKEAALEPFHAAIEKRKADAQGREDQARREREEARQRADVEQRVDRRLSSHLGEYIREMEEEDDIEVENPADRWELENNLKKRIRPLLLSQVREEPDMSDPDIDELVEELIEEHIEDFLDD
jgi:excisionase family DNA binding protein